MTSKGKHTYAYIHMYIHTYIHTYIHACIHAYIHTYIHTYIKIHTYIHTYIHTHTYVHTYIHTYTYMCTYVHIYIYMHNRAENLARYIHIVVINEMISTVVFSPKWSSGNSYQFNMKLQYTCIITYTTHACS